MEKIWNKIDWTRVEFMVYDLQSKIFQSSKKERNCKQKIVTRNLQKQLLNLAEAKMMSVRKVTQDNRDKVTAGVDGVKTLNNFERIELLSKLHLDGSSNAIRRVLISKKDEKPRTLGITTVKDRAKQALVLLALEPEWEALFETNSYGYRPCYSVADAKWAITRQIQGLPKYILDGEIKGCFDKINHDYLLEKLNQSNMISTQIKSWLKAGIFCDFKNVESNIEKTPEGGILSPLLSNIALHGMENAVKSKFGEKLKLIRYSDDFLVLGKNLEDVKESKIIIENFLKPIGLELSCEKTSISHSLEVFENKSPGVNFLGFHFKNISCSKHLGVKSTRGVKQTFIQQCIPSCESVRTHKNSLKALVSKYKNAPLEAVINQLSLKIRGWTEYFCISQSTKTFSQLDGWFFKVLWKWSVKRYKSSTKAKEKCFSVDGWKFGFKTKDKIFILKRHDQTKVKNHIKIQANASIYDSQLLYFAKRVSLSNSRVSQLNGLFKKQEFKCGICHALFKPTDKIEIHHVIKDFEKTGEIQLLHNFCHDRIHSSNS